MGLLMKRADCEPSYREDYRAIVQKRELRRIPFYHRSPQIRYRKHAIKHMRRISVRRKLSTSTLHLAVYLLDVFMDNHEIVSARIPLVANVCLLLGAKVEESGPQIPKITDLDKEHDFSVAQFKTLEKLVLEFFDFSIMFPTTPHFTFYFMMELISDEDLAKDENETERSVFYKTLEWVDLCLSGILLDVHYMQCYAPSRLGAAVLAVSRVKAGFSPWTAKLEAISGYALQDFNEIVEAFLKGSQLRCPQCRSDE